MFDVFYIGKKPNLFAHEREALSIEHARQQSRTRYCWIVTYLADYADFDFLWEPPPWQASQRHAWASQWQKDCGTYLVPKAGYIDTNYHARPVITMTAAAPIYLIDHMDGTADEFRRPVARRIRYFDNYKDTLTRLAANILQDQEFVWICSTICNYEDFDFSWHPEIWQNQMLHVFPSAEQKFGDTFFMHVPSFRSKIAEFELLDWYDINFVTDMPVPRRPMPVISHQQDSHVDMVKNADWRAPLMLFKVNDHGHDNMVTVSLWRDRTRTVVPLDPGAESVIVPRDAVPYVKTQIYDYPYIDKTKKQSESRPLDIVFISNGEHGSEHHWNYLCDLMRGRRNRLVRSANVNGRVAAYHAAANASSTPWFFAVFAKLQVNQDFDWSWQPDRMQQAKHYIFHAYNPVNHLVYGHQAMIAYNKKLVMANQGQGLDFTLDDPHEVVPMISGTAYYDNDPWTCWRTAFRESLKLRHSLPDVENDYRLQQWLSVGEGVNGHWSTAGANDAVKYYESVGGNFHEIKKSYEWAWLAAYAMMLHPELFTQSRT